MPTESPPSTTRAEVLDVAQDLDHLTWDSGPNVVDHHLDRAVARLRAVADAMAEPDAGLTRVGPGEPLLTLQNPAGQLLWARNNHGTWPADYGQEHQTFLGESHFRHWLDQKPRGYVERLANEGWRLVELVSFTRPHVPKVAEACVAVGAEGGAA